MRVDEGGGHERMDAHQPQISEMLALPQQPSLRASLASAGGIAAAGPSSPAPVDSTTRRGCENAAGAKLPLDSPGGMPAGTIPQSVTRDERGSSRWEGPASGRPPVVPPPYFRTLRTSEPGIGRPPSGPEQQGGSPARQPQFFRPSASGTRRSEQ